MKRVVKYSLGFLVAFCFLSSNIFSQGNLPPGTYTSQNKKAIKFQEEAKKYIDPKKKVDSIEAALAGARDIMAEWINEDGPARKELRELFVSEAVLTSKVIKSKEQEAANYKDYFDLQEQASKSPSHRILAVRRGERRASCRLNFYPRKIKPLKYWKIYLFKVKAKIQNRLPWLVPMPIKDY